MSEAQARYTLFKGEDRVWPYTDFARPKEVILFATQHVPDAIDIPASGSDFAVVLVAPGYSIRKVTSDA